MNEYTILLLVLVLLLSTALSAVTTVKSVSLERYLGKWYQTAYYPNSFQPRDCGLTVAEYSLDNKGKINVKNTCYEDTAGTKVKKQANAKAWAVDKTNAKLKVSFFWPFRGDYWIVKLADDYRYSVVSDSKQKYLWILSRNMELSRSDYNEILAFLDKGGWDSKRLVITGKVK
ncbi:MAG TPA: lipocalin family protein [Candidatus Cloacimonadota bacterium]|nr:lipocalin family protein [Candidatus Cloacimonadota bacterium]